MTNTTKIAFIYPIVFFGSIASLFIFAPGPSFFFWTYFFLYLVASLHVGLVAKTKGRNPITFFLLTILFTPLITGLVLAVMKPEMNSSKSTKKCPYCAEDILIEAIKCKECGSSL